MNSIPKLSESEWVVFLCFRRNRSLEIKDIVSQLKEEKNWNANMIRTLIVRLQNKGVVAADRTHNVYRYCSLINVDEAVAEVTRRFVGLFFNGDVQKLIQNLTDNYLFQSDD